MSFYIEKKEFDPEDHYKVELYNSDGEYVGYFINDILIECCNCKTVVKKSDLHTHIISEKCRLITKCIKVGNSIARKETCKYCLRQYFKEEEEKHFKSAKHKTDSLKLFIYEERQKGLNKSDILENIDEE